MSRTHQHHAGASPDAYAIDESSVSARDPRQLAMMKRARERKQARDAGQSSPACAEARHKLRDKVTSQVRETGYAALDVFQSMVRADERRDAEVDASFGKTVATKLIDWLTDKSLEVATDSFELGETIVAGPISAVFGAAKGGLESMAELGQKLRAIDAVDHVVKFGRQAVDLASAAGGAAVDKIDDQKMAEAAGVLAEFEGLKDDADGEAEGTLRHALENWAMETLFGAPKTGGAAIHDEAKTLYEVYRAEVRKGEPVGEQVEDIAEVKSGEEGRKVEDAAAGAEERLGIDDEVRRDTAERARIK